jgi:hypothetical protein
MGSKKGKVILLEAVLAAGNEPHIGKFIDIEMLAMLGDRERNERGVPRTVRPRRIPPDAHGAHRKS